MLSVRAEPDPESPLVQARIVLEGLARSPAEPVFCLRREGYPSPNLGPGGWQVREEPLRPRRVRQDGADTVFYVGYEVSQHLEPGPYLFVLPGTGEETSLFWPDSIDLIEQPVEAALPPPAPPPPTPPPPSPPTPAPMTGGAERSPPPAAIETPRPVPTPIPAPSKPNRLPALLAAVVLVLAAAGGGYWALKPGPAPDPGPTPVPGPAPAPSPAPVDPPRPAPGQAWLQRTDGMSLRELVDSAPDAAGIYAAALRRQAAGQHDDALVLFEEAGDRGHAPALTALARLYDPNGFVAGRPFRNPDPRAAARYYRDAAQRGDQAAAAPRAALRSTLEEQARAGNGTADSALREFWP